jgi:hypothetical protein
MTVQAWGVFTQGVIALVSGLVAIWIVIYQQRAIGHRDQHSVDEKTKAIATVVAREALDFVIGISVPLVLLEKHSEYLSDVPEPEVLERTKVVFPDSLVADLGKAQVFGPELALLLVRTEVSVLNYNSCQSIQTRLVCSEALSTHVRSLDRALGRILGQSAIGKQRKNDK